MANLPKQKLDELQMFIEMVTKRPEEIHRPELKFFKDYLLSLNAQISPEKKTRNSTRT